MSVKYERNRVRIKLDGLVHTAPLCLVRSATAKAWRGADLQIELGLFYNAFLITDFSNIANLYLEIHDNADRDGDPLVQKTVAGGSLTVITDSEWTGGTAAKYNALVVLTKEDMQLSLGTSTDNTAQFWVVVHAVTNDATPRYITYGGFVLQVEEDGAQNGLSVIAPSPAARLVDGELQLWNPDQSKWHTIYVRGAAGAEYFVFGAGES